MAQGQSKPSSQSLTHAAERLSVQGKGATAVMVAVVFTCVCMGLKCEKRYMASKAGQPRADTGRGSRSSKSVWGGCTSGKMRPLKLIGSKASAPSHVSDTALRYKQVLR